MVICLEQGADLHMAQLMPLPLTVSCFSKIQIGFTFLVPAHPGSPGHRAVKRVCVCVCPTGIRPWDSTRGSAQPSYVGNPDIFSNLQHAKISLSNLRTLTLTTLLLNCT